MGDGKHARTDNPKGKSESSSDEGGLFGRVMGGLKTVKDAAVTKGGQVIQEGGQVIREGATLARENAPKLREAAVEARDSKVGKAVIAAGTDAYRDEKKHVVGIGEAAKRGDVKTLVREGAPLLAGGPAGLVADRAIGQAMKQGVKALPADHQGPARDVLNLANGGIPDAQDVIVGTVLDSDKRHKAAAVASEAGHAVVGGVKKGWGWITGGHGADSVANAEAKAGRKSGQVEYPDNDKPQKLPKPPATPATKK